MEHFVPSDKGKVREDLQFTYAEDIEGDQNRGWVVHKIEAYLAGENVGYLKISYISSERFKRHYPHLLNYLSKMEGHCVLPFKKKDWHWKDIPVEELRSSVYVIALEAGFTWTESCSLSEQAKQVDDKRLMLLMEGLVRKLKKRKTAAFRHFKGYHVDKPIVDYIQVNEGFRRQGIGTALYRAGYRWMKSKGLPFYASTIQTKEAVAAWKGMANIFPMKRERIRVRTGNYRLRTFVRTRFCEQDSEAA